MGLAGEKAFPSPAEAAKAALQRVAAKAGPDAHDTRPRHAHDTSTTHAHDTPLGWAA